MSEGGNLHSLQCLDSEADKRRRRLAEVEAAIGESDVLRQAQEAVEAVHARVREWALRQRNLELEIQGLGAKTSRSEQRLYGGTVKNPKELSELQAEIAALKRRREQLEESLLAAMIEVEEAESAESAAQEHLERTQSEWSSQQAKLESEREALGGRLKEIEDARTALLPALKVSDLEMYKALRRRKGGLAVVLLRDGICGGCGVGVTPNLEWKMRQGELVTCGNCGRIIVRV